MPVRRAHGKRCVAARTPSHSVSARKTVRDATQSHCAHVLTLLRIEPVCAVALRDVARVCLCAVMLQIAYVCLCVGACAFGINAMKA